MAAKATKRRNASLVAKSATGSNGSGATPSEPEKSKIVMLSKNGREVRVGCLIQDSHGDVGHVTYVEGNVVVYRYVDPEMVGSDEPLSAEFRRSDVTVIEEPPMIGRRKEPDYYPYTATWDVGYWKDDDYSIYHVLPDSKPFDKNMPVVATVAINPDLGADPQQILQMMAYAPELWRELREMTSKYVWTADSSYTPETMEDFARITNLLIQAGKTFPWDSIDAHNDNDLYTQRTKSSAAKVIGNGKAVADEA